MHGSAMTPQRRADGAHARAARALLLPQFLSRARHFMPRFRRGRSRPPRSGMVTHRFIYKRFVHFGAEHRIGELNRAHHGAIQIHNVYTRHRSWSFVFPRAPYRFARRTMT
jgi:hypothetical protein